jgi:hypothetical protein
VEKFEGDRKGPHIISTSPYYERMKEKFEGDRKGPHPTQPHSRPYNVRKESPLLYILR